VTVGACRKFKGYQSENLFSVCGSNYSAPKYYPDKIVKSVTEVLKFCKGQKENAKVPDPAGSSQQNLEVEERLTVQLLFVFA